MHDSTQSAWAVNTRIWLVSWKTLISYNYMDSCLCCSILEYAQYYRDITDQYTKTLHFMPNSKMICNLRQIELCTNKWEKIQCLHYMHACSEVAQSPNKLSNAKLTWWCKHDEVGVTLQKRQTDRCKEMMMKWQNCTVSHDTNSAKKQLKLSKIRQTKQPKLSKIRQNKATETIKNKAKQSNRIIENKAKQSNQNKANHMYK